MPRPVVQRVPDYPDDHLFEYYEWNAAAIIINSLQDQIDAIRQYTDHTKAAYGGFTWRDSVEAAGDISRATLLNGTVEYTLWPTAAQALLIAQLIARSVVDVHHSDDDRAVGVVKYAYYADNKITFAFDVNVAHFGSFAVGDAVTVFTTGAARIALADAVTNERGKVNSGPTSSRPDNPGLGERYFDTDLNLSIEWDGSTWRPFEAQYLSLGNGSFIRIGSSWTTVRTVSFTPRTSRVIAAAIVDVDESSFSHDNIINCRIAIGSNNGPSVDVSIIRGDVARSEPFHVWHSRTVMPSQLVVVKMEADIQHSQESVDLRSTLVLYG